MADDLKRAVVWKNLLIDGRDYCGLWRTAQGWMLKGMVIGVLKDQRSMLASYEIHCDENWLTHRVQVERTNGNDVKTLSLSVENRGMWRSTGQELRDILGALFRQRGSGRLKPSAASSRCRCFARAARTATSKVLPLAFGSRFRPRSV
jgi:Putative glycolipid-binding